MSGLECYNCGKWFGHCQCKETSQEQSKDAQLVKEITAIWETFDHTTFNQQSTAVAFGKAVLALRQVKE